MEKWLELVNEKNWAGKFVDKKNELPFTKNQFETFLENVITGLAGKGFISISKVAAPKNYSPFCLAWIEKYGSSIIYMIVSISNVMWTGECFPKPPKTQSSLTPAGVMCEHENNANTYRQARAAFTGAAIG